MGVASNMGSGVVTARVTGMILVVAHNVGVRSRRGRGVAVVIGKVRLHRVGTCVCGVGPGGPPWLHPATRTPSHHSHITRPFDRTEIPHYPKSGALLSHIIAGTALLSTKFRGIKIAIDHAQLESYNDQAGREAAQESHPGISSSIRAVWIRRWPRPGEVA